MYELAATSRQERPHPITKVHPTKPLYFRNLADGQKNIAPRVVRELAPVTGHGE